MRRSVGAQMVISVARGIGRPLSTWRQQVGIIQDIKESMLEEVDFQKEAANIESFRRYLESMGLTGQATAPKVYQHCSTKRILTMERLYGVPLTDLDSIRSFSSDPEMTLVTALNVCG
ncbi:hypothetical protein Taro_051290 [Colocasia esculenta]|uniref:ABC1 atypical kinase-like domain-containing protein n=1 Tax=Colocasia esculenta TaxID=4460 RepID=A0A843XGC1_COLES|nr:hypothetical protein [Colocasia esculenta]